MAGLPHRRHGNHPHRRTAILPQVAECAARLLSERKCSEPGPEPAEEAKRPVRQVSSGFSQVKQEADQLCNGKSKQPHEGVAALLRRIRIHPQALRILGKSSVPVVSLQRLNFSSVSTLSLQPVVSLVRLPWQQPAELDRQQNRFSPHEADIVEIRDDSPQSLPEHSSDLSLSEPRPSWTEPYCPDTSASEEPEQDSGFDCESNPDQPFILFDLGSDEWDPDGKPDSETFFLDPDPEPTLVIQLDPEPEADHDQSLQLEDECESKCEVDIVEMDDSADQRPDLGSAEEGDPTSQQPEPGAGPEEKESEDFCAVCLNGGDLLCCDRCPKVFHLDCHIPALSSFPLGDWMCSLCRSDLEPVEAYDCEHTLKAPYTLPDRDQRRCEKLALMLFCHPLSAPFHEPVSPLARNYYQIIRRPVDLSAIRRKLDRSNTLHYFTSEQFVDDVLLMLKNCATFNYPDSEVAQAGRSLEVFFLSRLKEFYPDRTFPSASQDRTDRARLRWLSKKRKDNYKRKYVFRGKRYYL